MQLASLLPPQSQNNIMALCHSPPLTAHSAEIFGGTDTLADCLLLRLVRKPGCVAPPARAQRHVFPLLLLLLLGAISLGSLRQLFLQLHPQSHSFASSLYVIRSPF